MLDYFYCFNISVNKYLKELTHSSSPPVTDDMIRIMIPRTNPIAKNIRMHFLEHIQNSCFAIIFSSFLDPFS